MGKTESVTSFQTLQNQPVILCGHPKSGTTLLLALLDNHPQLTVFPEEFKFFQRVYGTPDPSEVILTQTGFNAFRFDKVIFPSGERDYSDIDFIFIESEIRKLCSTYKDYKDIFIGCMKIWHQVGS